MSNTTLPDLWVTFRRTHGNCSVDRMLCNSQMREDLLAAARPVCTGQADEEILWSLVNLRKKKLLPR